MRAIKITLLASGLSAMLGFTTGEASGINGINGGMPNRISMNVTVAKQTQGTTFGEKVGGGLHAAAGAVAQGASLSMIVECGHMACAIAFPDGDGYRADLQRMALAPLDPTLGSRLRGPTATWDASLLGEALPGGGIVSASVSSVGSLGGAGGGAAAASYAATGRMAPPPVALASRSDGPGVVDVVEPMADGDYKLTLVVQKVGSGLKDTLKTQVRQGAPSRLEIVVAFNVANGRLKARHDVALNAIRNLR